MLNSGRKHIGDIAESNVNKKGGDNMPHGLTTDKHEAQDVIPETPELSEVLARVRIIPQEEIDTMSNFLELDGHRNEAQCVIDDIQRVTSFLQKAVTQIGFHLDDDVVTNMPIAISRDEHRVLLQKVREALTPYIRRIDARIKVVMGQAD